MMGPQHAWFGAAAYLAMPAFGVDAPLVHTGVAVLCALGPDIDHPSSTVSKFAGMYGKLFRDISDVKHRGLTHRWWFMALVLIPIASFAPAYILPVGIGWGSHLLGDMIPKTGGWLENYLVRPFLWFAVPMILVYVHLLGWRF